MFIKKQHYSNQLSGRFFHCSSCNKLPCIIREIRNINDDSLINIELVDQREYGCVISYDLGPCSFSPKSTYEIITCGECFILVNTIINLGIKA